jgi:RHS repeat-associated protein
MANPGRVTVGHPVDVASGVVFTAWADFEIGGALGFEWLRSYTSAGEAVSALGRGWQSPFFASLEQTPGGIAYRHEDGSALLAADPATGRRINSSHKLELLERGGNYVVWDWGNKKYLEFQPAASGWRLAAIDTPAGFRTVLAYDDGGRLIGLDQAPLRRFLLRYDARGLISAVELWAPGQQPLVLVRYEYDSAMRMVAAYDAAGAPIRYAYDDAHRLIRETNRLGFSFYFEYDAQGRCWHTWGDGGHGERWLDYAERGRLTQVRDRGGNKSTYHYNANGQVTKEVDPIGAVTETTFDLEGRIAVQKFPAGGFLNLVYDALGNISAIIDGLGHKTEYKYNDLHLAVERKAADGSTRSFTYDERGNLLSRTDETGAMWTYRRDERGRLSEATTPNGHRTTILYGDSGLWHELRDSVGFIRYECDLAGNLLQITDTEGVEERRSWDARGNLTAVTHPDGTVYSFAYDADENVIADQDENGRRTVFLRNLLGDATEVTYADASRVRLFYDSEGRLLEIENENGARSLVHYDGAGRVVWQQFFDGRVEEYTYDAGGLLVGIRKPDGSVVRQAFNAIGNLVDRAVGETVLAHFEFDACDRVLQAASPGGGVAFEYDAAGRLLKEKQGDQVVDYEHDREGNCIRRQYVQGNLGAVRFEYDLRRRLRKVLDASGLVQEFFYDALDRVRRRNLRGPAEETLSYDAQRRLAQQELRARGSVLVRRRYKYDPSGELIALEDLTSGRTRFGYEDRGWLTEVETQRAELIAYDAAGNLRRTSGGEFSSVGNRLLSGPVTRYEYNVNGQLVTAVSGADRTAYEYDGDENLVRVTHPNGSTTTFAYDAMARRISKSHDGAVTRYVWAGHQLAAELRPDGSVVEHLTLHFQPLGQFENGSWFAAVTNHLSVPYELIGDAGQLVWRARYSGFGALEREEGGDPSSPFRLPGQYADRETGLYYNRFRYYDPAVGRYITPDPIGLFGGLNEYRYAENPITWEDPLGLKCKLVHFKIKANTKKGTLAQWRAKRDAFNQARQDPNAKIPSKTVYDNKIRPAADREAAKARAGGGYTSAQDADHPGDVRATGLIGQTLQPRISGVNRSWGSQVGRQAGQRTVGSQTPMADLVDPNDPTKVIQ